MFRSLLQARKRSAQPASWLQVGFAFAVVVAVGGCQAFTMGNPLLPRARLQASTLDTTTTITLTPTSAKTYTYTVSPQVTRFHIGPVQGDLAPAATITAYQIDWYDINGATISPTLIPERTQGVSILLPRGAATTGGTSGGIGGTTGGTMGGTTGGTTTGGTTTGGIAGTSGGGEVDIPLVTTALTSYGFNNGYTVDPVNNIAVPRGDAWSQYLTGKVTFSGRDENGWPIVGPDGIDPVTAYFQLQFVTQASGSTAAGG